MESALKRWQSFADRKGDDARSRAVRAEGHFRVAIIWEKLGDVERARQEFELASEAINQVVQEIPSDGNYRFQAVRYGRNLGMAMANEDKFSEAEKQLQDSLQKAEEVVRDFPDVPRYRLEMIRCLESLGNRQRAAGRRKESESNLRKAVELQEELVKQHPEDEEFRFSLATCYLHLAIILESVGSRDAKDNFAKSLTEFERLVVDSDEAPKYLKGLALCLRSFGGLNVSQGDLVEGEKMLRRAASTYQTLADDFPTAPEYRDSLADTHHSLGWMLRDYLSNTEGAEAEYRRALAIRERLIADFPNSPDYRASLALSHFTLGYILYSQDKIDDARTEYLTSLRIYHEVDGEIAQVYQARNVGRCLWSLGDLEADVSHNDEALDWYNKAIELMTPVFKLDPHLSDLRELLQKSHRGRAVVKRRLKQDAEGDWDEALRFVADDGSPRSRMNRVKLMLEARRFQAVVPELDALVRLDKDEDGRRIWNQVDLFNFAAYYSRASLGIPEHADELEDQSMELLTRAVDAGFMDLPFLLRFTTLDPIRKRPEFTELIERMKSQSKKD